MKMFSLYQFKGAFGGQPVSKSLLLTMTFYTKSTRNGWPSKGKTRKRDSGFNPRSKAHFSYKKTLF
jgi:hypothetical protein